MRSNQDDDAIDAAIAEAARSLTAADPSSKLRVAVRDRIERPSIVASSCPSFVASALRWKTLVPAGAAAAAVAVVLFVGRSAAPPSTPTTQPRSDAPAVVAAPAVTLPVTPREATPAVDPVATTVTRPSLPPPAAMFESTPEELEPLIPPITIPLLETKQIAVDTSSGVMPIEIMPLRIEPLQGE